MQIEIVNVTVENKGKYSMATVAYRNDGKLAEKKVMSFGNGAKAFAILGDAKPGQQYNVRAEKNDKGYWDWVEVSEGGATAPAAGAKTTPTPRSTYETPEERAQRQILIVRQSSVSSAIEYYKAQTKAAPTVDQVLEVAKQFENYVFGKKEAEFLDDLTDDIPL